MGYNMLYKVVQEIEVDTPCEVMRKNIQETVHKLGKLYSYLVYTTYKNNVLAGWSIQYNLSQDDNYNTLEEQLVVDNIVNIISTHKLSNENKYVIGYDQPPVDIMIELFDPLVKKLAREQKLHWQNLEYDDLCQMCRLVILTLHRKGYYIHKKLVETSFVREVLMSIQNEQCKPITISLDTKMSVSENDNDITVADIVPDANDLLEQEHNEYLDAVHSVFEELKEIIVDRIGERKFEQLYKAYANKNVEGYAKTMKDIRKYLTSIGITKESFKNYF